MSASVGTAYVDIKPDLSSMNRELARQINPMASQFGGKFGKALGPVMAQQTKHLERGIQLAKIATAGAAAVAAYGLKDVVEDGSRFERQLDINAAIAAANLKQSAAMERQALKLGRATFFSANEAAEAQAELVKGGLKVAQVLGGGLPAALTLAEAGELDLATAGETLVNQMKLFDLGGKEAMSVSDMLSTAANRTTADVLDYAMAMKQGGSVTKLAGYDMNNTLTILEALAEAGIKNSDAGTSMKAATIQLLKPTEKQEKLARLLGIHWETQAGTLKTAAGLSKELRIATDDMTKAERAKALATLAGTDGVRTLNALYASTPKELRALEAANEKQGTASDIAQKKMDNVAGSIEQFKGSIETAEIQIYKGMAPALGELTDEATAAVNAVGAVFDDPRLSGGEKVEKAISVLSDQVGDIWERNDVTEHLVDAMDAAIPIIAEHAGTLGFEAAQGFVRGFLQADLLGKVVMGAWLLHFIGGKAPFIGAGKSLGRLFGLNFATQAAETAAGAGVATKMATAAVAATAVPAASHWTSGGPVLGTGPARAKAAQDTARAILAEQMGGFSLATAGAAQQAMASSGRRSAREFVTSFSTDVRSRASAALPAISAMGSRLARGVGTWGLGGLMVGEISKEVIGGDAGQQIGSALQGAGVGAAIGSAIAPGVGTAVGAAIGATAAEVLSSLSDDTADRVAEDFLRAFEGRAPEIQRMVRKMDLGSEGRFVQKRGGEESAGFLGLGHEERTFSERVGERGLKGLGAELRDKLKLLSSEGASDEALDAIRAKLKAVNAAIAEGTKSIDAYSYGFDLLRSGVAVRMEDIAETVKRNRTEIDAVWANNPERWRQATANNMRSAIEAIRAGMKSGEIEFDSGLALIKSLIRKANLFEGRDPLKLAKGFAAGWKEAGEVNDRSIDRVIKDLGKMPKPFREKTQNAMIAMARAMEQKGQLVEGSADRLRSALVTKFGKTNKTLVGGVEDAVGSMGTLFGNLTDTVSGALADLGVNVNSVLVALGVNKGVLNFSLKAGSGVVKGVGNVADDVLDFVKKQDGGFIVPGRGDGDSFPYLGRPGDFVLNREATRTAHGFQDGGRVPLLLEPGERYFPREEVAAIGRPVLEAANAAVPRFGYAKGGGIKEPQIVGPDPLRALGQAGIHKATEAARDYVDLKRPNASAVGSGASVGLGDAPANLKAAMALAQAMGLTITSTTGGAHAPGSWHYEGRAFDASNGVGTPQQMAYAIAAAKRWGSQILELFYDPLGWYIKNGQKVSGAIGDHSDHVHTAMQLGGLVQKLAGGGGVGNINHLWAEHEAPDYGGPKLPPYVIAALAEAAGAPGITMEQVTRGESSGRPGSSGTDAAMTNGNVTKGWGLWAITSGVGNDALVAPYGGYPEMLNPVKNAAVMAKMYAASGLSPWHGDQYVTGDGQHYTGNFDIRAALGGATFEEALGGKGAGSSSETPTPEQVKGKYTKYDVLKHGDAPDELRAIKAKYKVQTDKLSFDSIPDNLEAVSKELALRHRQLGEYQAAHARARNQEVKAALLVNVKALQHRIKQLLAQRARLLAKKARERVLGKIAKRGILPGAEAAIAGAELAYEKASEFASQVTSLEPEEGPAVKDWIANREAPAWAEVLGAEAHWRNAILGGEDTALQRFVSLEAELGRIDALKSMDKKAYAKQKFRIPALRQAVDGIRQLYSPAASLADLFAGKFSNPRTGSFEDALVNVQGRYDNRARIAALPSEPVPGSFGGLIWDTQQQIRELGLKLAQSPEDSAAAESLELQKQLTLEANQRALASESMFKAFRDFEKTYAVRDLPPYAGKFHEGGVVPGPYGSERSALVMPGERIRTPEQELRMAESIRGMAAAGEPRVIVNGDIVQESGDTRDPVEVLLGDRRLDAKIEGVVRNQTPRLS